MALNFHELVQWHALLAWVSIALFFLRGAVCQFGTLRVQVLARDARLVVLSVGINACLVVSGLSLWSSMGYHPLRDGWLGIKLIALIGYAGCGHWAMSRDRLHLLGYLTALALLALAMDLSINRGL